MINKQRVLGMLGISAKAGKVVFGSEACEEAIYKKKVKLVLVAENAADRTKRNFELLCEKCNIAFITFGLIDEISKAIGKENKAVIGIKDRNLSGEILKIINGGEFIGENKNTRNS